MKEELKQVDNDIKDLEDRLKILKQRKKTIESKIDGPDLKGKYIKFKDNVTTYYVKVDDVTRIHPGIFGVVGFVVQLTILAIKIKYKIDSDELIYLPSEYEIITEEEFSNKLIEVVGKLCDKVEAPTSFLKPFPEIKPWKEPPYSTVVMYGCPDTNWSSIKTLDTIPNNVITKR